jgi:hypothetical protein
MAKKDAFTVERKPLPPMTPCAACGRDAKHEFELFVLDRERWFCHDCFFKATGRGWSRPRQALPSNPRTVAIDLDRVRHWLDRVREFERECRAKGKTRTSNADLAAVSISDRDLSQAVECAVVELLGGTPNLGVKKGNDGGIDGVLLGVTYDVKATVIHTNWDGVAGFNNPDSPDGRVTAQMMVGALVKRDISRCEMIGYAMREAPMRQIAGFKRPAYAIADLKSPHRLVDAATQNRGGK